MNHSVIQYPVVQQALRLCVMTRKLFHFYIIGSKHGGRWHGQKKKIIARERNGDSAIER